MPKGKSWAGAEDNSGYIHDPALYTKKNKDKENPDKEQAPLEWPIGNKAANAARSLEEKQIEVDMRTAAALETRAKLHEDQLTYKILMQIPDCNAAKEWFMLKAEAVLTKLKAQQQKE